MGESANTDLYTHGPLGRWLWQTGGEEDTQCLPSTLLKTNQYSDNIVLGDLPDASCEEISVLGQLLYFLSLPFHFFFLHICNSCAIFFTASCAVGAADTPKRNTCVIIE